MPDGVQNGGTNSVRVSCHIWLGLNKLARRGSTTTVRRTRAVLYIVLQTVRLYL